MSVKTSSSAWMVLIALFSVVGVSAATPIARFGVTVVVLPFCQAAVSKVSPSVAHGPASAPQIAVRMVCNQPSSGSVEPNVAIEDQTILTPQIAMVPVTMRPSEAAQEWADTANNSPEKRGVATRIPSTYDPLVYSHNWVWQLSPTAKDIAFERITITY